MNGVSSESTRPMQLNSSDSGEAQKKNLKTKKSNEVLILSTKYFILNN